MNAGLRVPVRHRSRTSCRMWSYRARSPHHPRRPALPRALRPPCPRCPRTGPCRLDLCRPDRRDPFCSDSILADSIRAVPICADSIPWSVPDFVPFDRRCRSARRAATGARPRRLGLLAPTQHVTDRESASQWRLAKASDPRGAGPLVGRSRHLRRSRREAGGAASEPVRPVRFRMSSSAAAPGPARRRGLRRRSLGRPPVTAR